MATNDIGTKSEFSLSSQQDRRVVLEELHRLGTALDRQSNDLSDTAVMLDAMHDQLNVLKTMADDLRNKNQAMEHRGMALCYTLDNVMCNKNRVCIDK